MGILRIVILERVNNLENSVLIISYLSIQSVRCNTRYENNKANSSIRTGSTSYLLSELSISEHIIVFLELRRVDKQR